MTVSRDELCLNYIESLPYEPYPVQERAIFAWYETAERPKGREDTSGVLVCAPTGTGKTAIAEAALYEALATGQTAYYTTPLIALTDQKYDEIREAAVRWGFDPDDVGLVTGNRSLNPKARIKVVVAEILLNRLLAASPTPGDGVGVMDNGSETDPPSSIAPTPGDARPAFDFSNVSAVVMDEFHSFNEPERGVVWELSLALLPPHVKLMLLSATVGNAVDFLTWLRQSHGRKLDLVQSDERKVPLSFQWIGDQFLTDYLEEISLAEGDARRTPGLVFCFNRAECWSVAEQLKGKTLLDGATRKELLAAIDEWEWSGGAGPKLRAVLVRGVGVHHAGLLPKYRRRVEELFQRKLLAFCVCTETLAAGINLPARSVIMTSLMKGPPGKKTVVAASQAKQMFGRAGRPQFDDAGYVMALAHDDDVKILNFQAKLDQIPEDTKDPNLIKARKRLKKKAPKRRTDFQYWNESHFVGLQNAPSGDLHSRGAVPWRLLGYLLTKSPEVERLREFVRKRLLTDKERQSALKLLDRRLTALHRGGFVRLEPEPPPLEDGAEGGGAKVEGQKSDGASAAPEPVGLFGQVLQEALDDGSSSTDAAATAKPTNAQGSNASSPSSTYSPAHAHPQPPLKDLLSFRAIHPLFGCFLMKHLAKADVAERIQALEATLELPTSIGPAVRVPLPDRLPPGPLATEYLDGELLSSGLATVSEINPPPIYEQKHLPPEERQYPLTLADKLLRLFDAEVPEAGDVFVKPVWVVGPVLEQGDFNTYISSNDLAKQEGLVFRHLLRFILLCDECAAVTPDGMDAAEWQNELSAMKDRLTEICRSVDPQSTDETLTQHDEDPLLQDAEAFGEGLL